MKMLSKEEVRKLAPEQQKALGNAEAQRVRMREQLVERARRYRGMSLIAGLLMGAAMGLAMFGLFDARALVFAVIAVTGLVGFHTTGLNRRLDALMQLLDHEINNYGTSHKEKDDNAA